MGKHRSNDSTGLLGMPTKESKRYLKSRKPRGFLASAIINSTVIYALYWLLYACPAGVPSKDSPQICHRYHDLKHTVVTKAVPYLQPYYEQYAGPYINKGKPYYDQANALYSQYGQPAAKRGSAFYSSYVHPVAQKGATVAKSSYDARLGPLVNHRTTQFTKFYKNTYDKYLGKHLNTAQKHYDAAVAPYISRAQAGSQRLYNQLLIPAFNRAYPYGQAAAKQSGTLYAKYLHPQLLSLKSWVLELLNAKVFPIIRRIYYLHIEPQVNKVSDRFFQFNVSTGFAKLEKVSPEAVEASVSSSILSSATLSAKIESTVIAGETHTIEASAPTVDAKLQERIRHGVIDDLLSIAENNIAKEGAAGEQALVDKLEDVLPTIVKKEEILCEDYLKQLEKVTVDEVDTIERTIVSFASSQTNKGRDTHEITEELRPYFIKAGKNIHAQAVEVKAHLATVIENLETKVNKATFVVYEQVLAEGHKQKREPEQKLRYEMEGVTKKELKRLEALDDRVKTVEKQLNAASARILKQYTKTLTALLKDTEKKVETLAGGAANKLHTLRNIGPKKITVLDNSEQFGLGYLPVGMMLGAQAVYNQISTGIYGEPEPTPEMPEQIYNSIKSFVSGVPDHIDASSISSAAVYAASVASAQGVNAASAVSSAMAGVDVDAIASSASSAGSVASAQAASAYSAASKAATKVDTDAIYASVVNAKEYVGGHAADIIDNASAAVIGTKPAFTESIASKISEVVHGTKVPVKESVISKVHDVYDAASDKINSIVHGTPVAFKESIASKASEALYGTETKAAESILSRVAGTFDDIKEKASEFVHGSEEQISIASRSAASASSSLASVASKSSESLKSSASSASSLASKSLSSAGSVASRSSESLAKSASSASSLASKSASSASSVASKSSESLAKSASSASSVASRSAASASSEASKSLASAAASGKSAVSQETPFVQSLVDKAWEDYAYAEQAVEDVVGAVRNHVEL